MTPTSIVAYLALFAIVGFLFVFASLFLGWFLRPKNPTPVKLDTYECGEPAVGSSYVQFDLRFYVVALLFLIFDVEVAFFFPWATVFGKAVQLTDPRLQVVAQAEQEPAQLTPAAAAKLRELGVADPQVPVEHGSARENTDILRRDAGHLAFTALIDILVFFAVLLVGFAYVWFRGDLDWVRATSGPAVVGEQSDRSLVQAG